MTQRQAMLCAVAGFFFWVLIDIAMRLGGQQNLSPFFITAIMGLVALLSLVTHAAARRDFSRLMPRRLPGPFFIGVCSLLLNGLNVVALKHLPFTVFYIVAFMAPLVTAVAVSFLKHENLSGIKIACLITGFVGVLIAIGLRDAGSGEKIGYLAGFASVFTFVTYSLAINRITKNESADSIQFVVALVMTLGGAALSWGAAWPAWSMIAILVVGSLLNLVGNILYGKAQQYTTATNVAQIHYSQIVWGAIFGYLIWGEVPTWSLMVGSAIIVGAGLVVARQAHREEAAPPLA